MNAYKKNILIWTIKISVGILLLIFSISKIFPANSTTVPSISKILNKNNLLTKNTYVKKDSAKHIIKKTNSIFSKYSKFSIGTVDLDSGKVIICLFSLDCDHCQETNKILNELKKKYSNFPCVYILALGNESEIDNFFTAGNGKFPYLIITPDEFYPLLDKANYPPRLVFMDNGNIIGDFEKIDTTELMKTIAK